MISTGVWRVGGQEWPAIRTLKTGPDVACQESRGRGEAGQKAVHDELPQGLIEVDVALKEFSVMVPVSASGPRLARPGSRETDLGSRRDCRMTGWR